MTAIATPVTTSAPATPAVTTFDYTVVTVPAGKTGLYRDCYEAFGWQLEAAKPGPIPGSATSLSLKRPRGIKNRPVLDELQRTCETALASIERSKTIAASAVAYGTGLLGTASMAVAVFATIGSLAVPVLPFAIAGFALWLAPVALHKAIKSRKTRAADAAIERELATGYRTCEQAGALPA